MYNYREVHTGFMTQGDQYNVQIELTKLGDSIDIKDIDIAEFTFNNLTKQYPEEVLYDEASKLFLFPIKQRESFNLQGKVKYQARIKTKEGSVIATPIREFVMEDSLSKDVL